MLTGSFVHPPPHVASSGCYGNPVYTFCSGKERERDSNGGEKGMQRDDSQEGWIETEANKMAMVKDWKGRKCRQNSLQG